MRFWRLKSRLLRRPISRPHESTRDLTIMGYLHLRVFSLVFLSYTLLVTARLYERLERGFDDVAIEYVVPGTNTYIQVTLGSPEPRPLRLPDFLNFVAYGAQVFADQYGASTYLAQDNHDPLLWECHYSLSERYNFHLQSSSASGVALTWTRAEDLVRGLQDVLVKQEHQELPADAVIYDVDTDNEIGFATVLVQNLGTMNGSQMPPPSPLKASCSFPTSVSEARQYSYMG